MCMIRLSAFLFYTSDIRFFVALLPLWDSGTVSTIYKMYTSPKILEIAIIIVEHSILSNLKFRTGVSRNPVPIKMSNQLLTSKGIYICIFKKLHLLQKCA